MIWMICTDLLSANSPACYIKIQTLEDVIPCEKHCTSSEQPMNEVPWNSANFPPAQHQAQQQPCQILQFPIAFEKPSIDLLNG